MKRQASHEAIQTQTMLILATKSKEIQQRIAPQSYIIRQKPLVLGHTKQSH